MGLLPRLVIVVGLVLAVLLPGPRDNTPPPVRVAADVAPASCDWQHEYHRTLTQLGESVSDWRVTQLALGRGGQTLMDQAHAEVDPDVACVDVSSIVKHEWVHLQQVRVYGSYPAVMAYYGSIDRMELAADCGARLLGATYTTYLDRVGDCPAGLRRNAGFLINYQ